MSKYLTGVPLTDGKGNSVSDSTISFWIKEATDQIEGYLNLKVKKQIVEETLHYSLNQYREWGFIPTNFPAMEVHLLMGMIGEFEQITFPPQWVSTKKTSDDEGYHRSIFLVPNSYTAVSATVISSGVAIHTGWYGLQTIPNYWKVRYCTSFNTIPADILGAIGKLAAINVLQIVGDFIGGVGVGGNSVSLDGLSQNVTTTKSGGNSAFAGRQKEYTEELVKTMNMLKNKYDGTIFTCL